MPICMHLDIKIMYTVCSLHNTNETITETLFFTQVCIVALCGLCSPRRGLVSSAGQELSAFIPSTVVFNALPMQNRLSQIICMQHATKRVCYEEEAVFHHHHRSLLLPF